MGSENNSYYYTAAFYQNSPFYRKTAREYADSPNHFVDPNDGSPEDGSPEDAYPEQDQKRDIEFIMTNYFNPFLRPLRIPPKFNLPEELAQGHGINEHGVTACVDMVYAETHGMVPHRDPYPPPVGTAKLRILAYVEHVMCRFDRHTSNRTPEDMTTTLIRKRRGAEYWMNKQTGKLESGPQTSVIVYTWPSKNWKVELQCSRLLALVSLIFTAVDSEITVSMRELYYRAPSLFSTPKVVNRLVNDIATTCQVKLEDLYVTAESRVIATDQLHDIREEELNVHLSAGIVEWILVVEKETVFRNLEVNCFNDRTPHGYGIIITGKGYPDHSTHKFLKRCLNVIDVPVFGLFDCDPDGFQIAKTYMFPHYKHFSCPRMIRLIKPEQFVKDVAVAGNEGALMPLKATRKSRRTDNGQGLPGGDRKKIRDILQSLPMDDDAEYIRDLRKDLQTLQQLGLKGEIEALDDGQGGLARWLDAEMGKHLPYQRGKGKGKSKEYETNFKTLEMGMPSQSFSNSDSLCEENNFTEVKASKT